MLEPIVERMYADRAALFVAQRQTQQFDARVQELEDHVFYWKREEEAAKREAGRVRREAKQARWELEIAAAKEAAVAREAAEEADRAEAGAEAGEPVPIEEKPVPKEEPGADQEILSAAAKGARLRKALTVGAHAEPNL